MPKKKKKQYKKPKLTTLNPEATIKILKKTAAAGDNTAQMMIERAENSRTA